MLCSLPPTIQTFFSIMKAATSLKLKLRLTFVVITEGITKKTCQCPGTPNITTPPPPPRLINRGKLGISVWVELLLNKYAYGIPINRQLESYKTQGLELSQATVSFGLEAITPFFEPVAEAIREIVAKSDQWHADETRWISWAHETTGSHKHWLWVFLCDQAVYFSIADSRAAVVPESIIGDGAGTLVCDRYSAYKKTRE